MIIALDARPLIRRQITGAEQRARNILTAWMQPFTTTQADHEFHLLYPRVQDVSLVDDSLLANLPANFHVIEISSFQLPASYPMGSRILNALARAIGRLKPDVYHAFTPEVPRIRTCPVVPTVHDLSCELDPNVRRTTAGRALHQVTAQSVQYAERVIAVSS